MQNLAEGNSDLRAELTLARGFARVRPERSSTAGLGGSGRSADSYEDDLARTGKMPVLLRFSCLLAALSAREVLIAAMKGKSLETAAYF